MMKGATGFYDWWWRWESRHAQADRNPEGHDPAEGHGAKHESPVGEADAPERCSEHSIHSSSGRG